MLKTVFARAGSDKASFIRQSIEQSLEKSGRDVILLIPEQSSFETEKQLYKSLGDALFSRVKVLSFTNLSRLVKSLYGDKSGARLSPAGKIILSSCAADRAADSLKFYSRQSTNGAFAKKVSGIIDELKASAISSSELEKSIAALENDGQLYDKLSDISAIYNWYDALLGESYVDPSDELTLTLEKLGSGEFFCDYDVIINEFSSFNRSQLLIIEKMLQNSPSVTLILSGKQDGRARSVASFKTPNETYGKFKNLAQKLGVEIKAPVCLENAQLFENNDLAELEKLLAGEAVEKIKRENIMLYSAPSIKRECLSVAAEINRLVRAEGYRYRDIAVIGRDIESYLPFAEDAFRIYNIPFFADMRASLDTRPIVVLIVNLLETVISSFEPSRFLSYVKCAISPIDVDDATCLENYIELWSLSKKDLTRDFEKNPDGLAGEMDEGALERLNAINQTRKKAIRPIEAFKSAVYGKTGDTITREIYNFLKDNGILKKLSSYTDKIAEKDTALASEQYRAFKACMDVLSQLSALLGSEKVTLKRYLELFKMAINASDVGSVPHHLDEVTVSGANRARIDNVKAVFVVGLNEGVFPQKHNEDELFSDSDRKKVRQSGVEILAPSSVMNDNEQHYLYNALTCATSKVYLSYSRHAINSDPLLPSKIIGKIKDKLGVEETDVSNETTELFGTDEAAFEVLCARYNENSTLANSLREYFMTKADPTYRARLLSIDKGMRNREGAIGEKIATELYGSDLMLSPSQIEKYHLCKFSHFCRYGLNLNPQKRAEITAMDSGNAIHFVLEHLLRDYTKNELSAFTSAELDDKVSELLSEFLAVQIGSSALDDNRVCYSINRLKSTVLPVLEYIIHELDYSGFTPVDLELKIKHKQDLEPYIITSESGTKIGVHGKVDRVDVKKTGDKTYVRVIDYKSGAKSFSEKELDYGINLQMLLYLFSIWENGEERYGKDIVPSGVLYMPAKRPDVKITGSTASGDIDKQKQKELRMKGFVLTDENITNQDDKAFYSASFGDISRFTAIKNQTEKLLCKMADDLKLGEIAINPLYSGRENRACEHCDYKMICGFEEGDAHRTMDEKSSESEVQ